MKLLTLFAVPLAALISAPGAAAFVTNFDSYTNGSLIGQDNWTGSASAGTYARIVAGFIDQSKQLRLGFASTTQPTETTVTVGNSGYSEFLAGTKAIFDFRIIDQIGTNTAADRFGFNLTAGAGSVSIYLSPAASIDGLAVWELGYAINGGSYTKFSEDINVFESNVWNLSLAVTANAGNPLLSNIAVTVTGLTGATGNIVGAALDPTENVDSFGFSWDKTGPAFTTNYIAFDNLSVVPEPSSALLLGLSGLTMAIRRRRA